MWDKHFPLASAQQMEDFSLEDLTAQLQAVQKKTTTVRYLPSQVVVMNAR